MEGAGEGSSGVGGCAWWTLAVVMGAGGVALALEMVVGVGEAEVPGVGAFFQDVAEKRGLLGPIGEVSGRVLGGDEGGRRAGAGEGLLEGGVGVAVAEDGPSDL